MALPDALPGFASVTVSGMAGKQQRLRSCSPYLQQTDQLRVHTLRSFLHSKPFESTVRPQLSTLTSLSTGSCSATCAQGMVFIRVYYQPLDRESQSLSLAVLTH